DRAEAVAERAQVGDIRDRDVDARHLLVGEHDAAVDRDRGVAVLEDEQVEADLAEAAERNHPQRAHSAAAADGWRSDASSRWSTMKRRTRSMRSSRDAPSTAIGAPTTTSIAPEDGCHDPRGRILRLPRTTI